MAVRRPTPGEDPWEEDFEDFADDIDAADAAALAAAGAASSAAASAQSDADTAISGLSAKKTNSMSTNKLLGRGTAGTGVIEEITLGTGLSLTGTTLNGSAGGSSKVESLDYTTATLDSIPSRFGLLPYRDIAGVSKMVTPIDLAYNSINGGSGVVVSDPVNEELTGVGVGTTGQVLAHSATGVGVAFKTITQDDVGDGTTAKQYTSTEKSKLAGLATIATSGSASDLASGTTPTARLGSGTANSTTFLRGDGTWSTPSGTGDVAGPASAVANNLTSFNSTTGKLIKDSGKAAPTGVIVGTTDTQTLTNKTIGADQLTDGTTNKAFLATERTKLSGIATAATANSSDATLLARANHTGTQAVATITGLATVATSGSAADLTGILPTASLPPLAVVSTNVVASQAAMLALSVQQGDVAIRTDNSKTYILSTNSPSTLADWKELVAAGAVQSVNSLTGTVSLTQDTIGDGTTFKQYSATDKTKLAGIATGATANQSDATTNAAIAAAQAASQPLDSDLTAFAAKTAPTGAVVGTTDTQTLTNKTLTTPAISSPTGLVKADVGLSNVDNTSNATERTATATLTNKTLTAPAITSPTGIVKGDVGLGNVDNTSNATERAATATLTNKRITKRVFSTTDTATLTPDSDAYDAAKVTALAQPMTIAAPTGTPTDSQSLIIRIKDNATARALTWNAAYRVVGVVLPTTTVISKTVYVGAVWNSDDSKWDCIAVAQEA